jgi:hypothetical protein
MKPLNPPACAYDRLYATAAILNRQWRNAELEPDFEGRMIDAVLRHLERHPLPNGSPDVQWSRYACQLLRRFWRRNASRDYARLMEARAEGRLPEFTSLNFLSGLSAYEPQVGLYSHCGREEDAGEWGHAVAQQLIAWGTPREWAWAVVWHASGRTLDEVAYLMEERFQCGPISPRQLASWKRRAYPKAMARLRKWFGVEEGVWR